MELAKSPPWTARQLSPPVVNPVTNATINSVIFTPIKKTGFPVTVPVYQVEGVVSIGINAY
jgi:hypothetical protein